MVIYCSFYDLFIQSLPDLSRGHSGLFTLLTSAYTHANGPDRKRKLMRQVLHQIFSYYEGD